MVIGEDWCPDVYRGMPIIGRIAEVSGMDMRVFPRDENLDIMDEFLKNGEFRSIPVFVFYNSDQGYLWPLDRAAGDGNPGDGCNQQGSGRGDRRAGRDGSPQRTKRERVNSKFPDWQKESVRDIRDLLSKTLGI